MGKTVQYKFIVELFSVGMPFIINSIVDIAILFSWKETRVSIVVHNSPIQI